MSESLASVIAAVSSCVMFTHNSGCVSSLRQRDRGDIVACLLREVCSLLREFANIAFVIATRLEMPALVISAKLLTLHYSMFLSESVTSLMLKSLCETNESLFGDAGVGPNKYVIRTYFEEDHTYKAKNTAKPIKAVLTFPRRSVRESNECRLKN